MSQLKFSLIGLHLASVLQLTSTPHFLSRSLKDGKDVVNVNTGDTNSVAVVITGEDDKKKITVNVTVASKGDVFAPVVTRFPDADTKNRVVALIKKGLDSAGNPEDVDGVTVIAPEEAAG